MKAIPLLVALLLVGCNGKPNARFPLTEISMDISAPATMCPMPKDEIKARGLDLYDPELIEVRCPAAVVTPPRHATPLDYYQTEVLPSFCKTGCMISFHPDGSSGSLWAIQLDPPSQALHFTIGQQK